MGDFFQQPPKDFVAMINNQWVWILQMRDQSLKSSNITLLKEIEMVGNSKGAKELLEQVKKYLK